tara:strand:+ start:155053 stop:155697 length:645 start_codon:yes stop_codon:yes gene_type:complete
MMTEVKHLNFKQILLFDLVDQNSRSNALKEFMFYLKYSGKRGKINFALSSSNENVHYHLTIKDNYILDSVPTSLIVDREDNFSRRVDNLQNPHLKELVYKTDCIERLVKDITPQEKKLVSVVKALLSDSEYIFLDNPDIGQDIEIVNIIKKAIIFEVENYHRKVFLKSDKREIWLDISTDIISRNENNKYIKTKNKLSEHKSLTYRPNTLKEVS